MGAGAMTQVTGITDLLETDEVKVLIETAERAGSVSAEEIAVGLRDLEVDAGHEAAGHHLVLSPGVHDSGRIRPLEIRDQRQPVPGARTGTPGVVDQALGHAGLRAARTR